MDKFLAIQNRFWSKVEKKEANECWNWQTGKGWNGYGQFFIDKKNIRAHRFSYEMHHNRKIAPGLIVMHTCDNRACVNPAHLVEGTARENIQDKVNKNRQARLPGAGLGRRAGLSGRGQPAGYGTSWSVVPFEACCCDF